MPRQRNDKPHLEWRRDKWAIVWWEGDERRRLSAKTADESIARQALADFEAALEAHPLAQTLAIALDRYSAARKGKIEAQVRLDSAAARLKDGLGHLRIDQVNQSQWNAYAAARVTLRNHMVATPHKARPVALGTLRREYVVLRAALRLAWRDGFLARPPVIEPPADGAPRDRYITKEEARRLVTACVTPHVRTFVALAIYTGARKGSILSLTWDRVNFRTGMVDFQEPGRRLTNKRRAVVPMGVSLRAELETAHELRQSDHVVEWNEKAIPGGIRASFKRLCVRAKLDWTPTPHHFKHSVASWMAMERIPIDQAADWLATDPATLRKVYRKFDPSYLRSVAGALELSGPLGPKRPSRPAKMKVVNL